jgi:uncharacterized protein (TIGR02145 family)
LIQSEDQDLQYNNNVGDWSNKGTPPTSNDDWNMADANPCPTGWTLPDKDQWEAVKNTSMNTKSYPGTWSASITDYTNFTAGLQLGDALFLPASGYREYNNGALYRRGYRGDYWSSSSDSPYSYCMYFESGSIYVTAALSYRSYGFNIRCVAE